MDVGTSDDKVVVTRYICIPIILSLYHRASIISTAILIVINSEPKVDDSTVFCDLKHQVMGAQLRKIRISVCESLVTF